VPPSVKKLLTASLVVACGWISPGRPQPVKLIAPPRTIADITEILDRVKPDPVRIEDLRSKAFAEPQPRASDSELCQFFLSRALSRSEIGLFREAISDAQMALKYLQDDPMREGTAKQLIALQYGFIGDYPNAIKSWLDLTETRSVASNLRINGYRNIEQAYISLGNLGEAELYLRRSESLLEQLKQSGSFTDKKRPWLAHNAEAEVSMGRAVFDRARGSFHAAELGFTEAERLRRVALGERRRAGNDNSYATSQMEHSADLMRAFASYTKIKQGRLQEAEIDARTALLSRLAAEGKYDSRTPIYLANLAEVLIAEGRFDEAERLYQIIIDIQQSIGMTEGLQGRVQSLSRLGAIYVLQRKFSDAQRTYDTLDKNIAEWSSERRRRFELTEPRIATLYALNKIEAGVAKARSLLVAEQARFGETHFEVAMARASLAVGLAKAGRHEDALREFRLSIPILAGPEGNVAGGDDATVEVTRRQQIRGFVENYISLVASTRAAGAATETFALADSIRGSSVQQALAESSIRASASDSALADIVREEQDLNKQMNAQSGVLNNLLATPPADRDKGAVEKATASLEKLRLDRNAIGSEIDQRFPSYADLVDPKSPSVDQARASLKTGEAMLSFYFGQEASFVWAIPKEGEVLFASIPLTRDELEFKVKKLREALEPQAAMVSDIPAFDLKLSYELYSVLLKPVEGGWKSAKSLIVVTNGALGLLPLSLLPTAPSEVRLDDDPLFSGYRSVPWLARTHAVTTLPSVAALRTLRQLPPGKANRGELIAFGDPYFSIEQQVEAETAGAKMKVADVGGNTTRGVPLVRRSAPKLEGVDNAELAMLPRLPDTADELKSIALALQADPSKVLNLGKNANEENVKTLDLSGFRILAFATHGLVPGELNGLTQPALALSSPAVTGGDGDGLLTIEEILGLKLDADWVVLSACNTGAGAGAGAEAASGLGRAFFYAGTRALLVTNWSVHSQSARELVTNLFKRQADDPKLTRGEALRQAMMALADGPGYVGADGKTEFTYAHPLFWAPYSIIGDGGAR
jgi:CHAT domain-containing protein